MNVFDFAHRATKGARDYQEDKAKVWSAGDAPLPDNGEGARENGQAFDSSGRRDSQVVAVLADGMGGHAGGALASKVVCDTFGGAFASRNGGVPERLLASLNDANDALAERVKSEPMLSGMGSTVIGANFGSSGVHWVSVGDSPLLLYRRGEIAQLNEDHSLAPELDAMAKAGNLSFEEARNDPRRSMLRSAVTGDDMDLVDKPHRAVELEAGDYVILASDGVQTLDDSEIGRIVSAYAGDGAEAVARALIRSVEAVRDPHQDNATVVVVRVLDGVGVAPDGALDANGGSF